MYYVWNLFRLIVLQFVSHLLSGSMVGLMMTSSKKAYATHCVTQVCCTQSPCPCGKPLLTHTSTGDTHTEFWLSLCGLGMCFVPFLGLSSSGDQVLGRHTVPGGLCILITPWVLATQFSGCTTRTVCLL